MELPPQPRVQALAVVTMKKGQDQFPEEDITSDSLPFIQAGLRMGIALARFAPEYMIQLFEEAGMNGDDERMDRIAHQMREVISWVEDAIKEYEEGRPALFTKIHHED